MSGEVGIVTMDSQTLLPSREDHIGKDLPDINTVKQIEDIFSDPSSGDKMEDIFTNPISKPYLIKSFSEESREEHISKDFQSMEKLSLQNEKGNLENFKTNNLQEEDSLFSKPFVQYDNKFSDNSNSYPNIGQLESISKVLSESESCSGKLSEDDWLDSEGRPTGERWAPLGAPNDDEDDNHSLYSYSELSWRRSQSGYGERASNPDTERLKELEEEQDQLNNSLMSLTSHFAQVQFRLKQIVDATPHEKEQLLQELDEFANRGIPDTRNIPSRYSEADNDKDHEEDEGLQRQKELIEKLKIQLEDLETYAYQTGEGGIPQSKVMEKQRVIIDQLRGKLNLNVDELDRLSMDDLRVQVDSAMRELINPLKMKEQLVDQLQTQITDLERFIDFLQGDGVDPRIDINKSPCKCGSAHSTTTPGRPETKTRPGGFTNKKTNTKADRTKKQEQLRQETENIMHRATTLMNMLSFGCGPSNGRFKKNTLKKTPQGNHWGDLRAALEVSINSVLDLISQEPGCDSDYTSESEESPMVAIHEDLTVTVRKQLAMALRDLMQHGLMPVGQSQSLVPFLGCFPQRSNKPSGLLHAWDLILKYYHHKKGATYNQTPARRLSQSFNLEITGGAAVTNKQTMLGVIGAIISSHTPLKRSHDSQFKAFVCAALNQKKLITWLRLIFRTQALVENYYQPWSYVSKTGFEDSLRSLEKLCKYTFDLPVNLAVRPFHNIKDAF